MEPTIVVVDDAPVVLRLVSEYFHAAGLKTLGCPDGSKAYCLIARVAPHVVILDISMPGVDGIEVFHQLRADPATRQIPIIFLATSDEQLWERLPNFDTLGVQIVSKLLLSTLPARVRQVLAARAPQERFPAIR